MYKDCYSKEKRKEMNRAYYEKNRDICRKRVGDWKRANAQREKETRRVWKEKNKEKLTKYCRIYNQQWRILNPDKVKANRQKTRDNLRNAVIDAYGGKCQCCSESTREFLAIDHINGGGNAHRRSLHPKASAQTLYCWLRKNNYPKGFQILCHNCNSAKAYYGGCPHQRNNLLKI
jgi:hypothetical protein